MNSIKGTAINATMQQRPAVMTSIWSSANVVGLADTLDAGGTLGWALAAMRPCNNTLAAVMPGISNSDDIVGLANPLATGSTLVWTVAPSHCSHRCTPPTRCSCLCRNCRYEPLAATPDNVADLPPPADPTPAAPRQLDYPAPAAAEDSHQPWKAALPAVESLPGTLGAEASQQSNAVSVEQSAASLAPTMEEESSLFSQLTPVQASSRSDSAAGQQDYQVTVVTGQQPATASSELTIVLVGSEGRTEERSLDTSTRKSAEPGQVGGGEGVHATSDRHYYPWISAQCVLEDKSQIALPRYRNTMRCD